MDTRTGDVYPSLEAAREAGVPDEFAAEVVGEHEGCPVVRFKSGPFKNRTYKRTPNGQLVRVYRVARRKGSK